MVETEDSVRRKKNKGEHLRINKNQKNANKAKTRGKSVKSEKSVCFLLRRRFVICNGVLYIIETLPFSTALGAFARVGARRAVSFPRIPFSVSHYKRNTRNSRKRSAGAPN